MKNRTLRILFLSIALVGALAISKTGRAEETPRAEAEQKESLLIRVLDPQGKPVSDAAVGIALKKSPLNVVNGAFQTADPQQQTLLKTDTAGEIKIPVTPENYTIVVLHPAGVAQVHSGDLNEKNPLILKPWARITGTSFTGKKPNSGKKIEYSYIERLLFSRDDFGKVFVNYSASAKTDENGKFEITHALPGLGNLMDETSAKIIRILPGEPLQFALGGTGAPVEGKFIIPPALQTEATRFALTSLRAVSPEKESSSNEAPEKPVTKTEAEKDADDLKFFEEIKNETTHYVTIGSDGSFRVEDVSPGQYRISATLVPASPDGNRSGALATGSITFDVPAAKEESSGTPLTLKPIPMLEIKHVDVGTKAPDFTFTDLEIKEHKLSGYFGKFVLLDFWATWCGPCIAEMPTLQSISDEFKSNPNLVVLSISIDRKIAPVLKFIAKKKPTWAQGHLNEENAKKALAAYGINGIPSVWLIGPDGKVIAKDLRGEETKTAVREALKRSQESRGL